MENVKKYIPFIIAGVAVLLVAAAFLIGTQDDVAPERPSIGDLLDEEPPVPNNQVNDGNLDEAAAGAVGSQGSQSVLAEDGTFDWYEVIDGHQWRYTLDDGTEMAIVFIDEGDGNQFMRTQTKPPNTRNSRIGSWTVDCPDRGRGWQYLCKGIPGDTVTVLLQIGSSTAYDEELHITFIDEDTLEARYDDMIADKRLTLRKIEWE